MAVVRVFHKYRGLSDFTLESLTATARGLLPRLAERQPRYKVSELPTERTIRFYISRGLVDKPIGRKGTSALYGYRHLLQILTIKYLQSEYLPLHKIHSLIQGRSNRNLELFLPEGATAVAPEFHYLDLGRKFRPPHEPRLTTGGDERTRALQPLHPAVTQNDHAPTADRGGHQSTDASERWHRLLIAPGMELHLRHDIRTPRDSTELERWREEFFRTLEKLRRG